MSKVKITQRPGDIIEIKKIIPNIIERMDYATKNNFTGNIVPGYNSPKALLHEDAAYALKKVQAELNKNNLGIIIYDAFRPYKSVEYFFKDWKKTSDIAELKNRYYPNKTKEQIFKDGFLKTNSSHCRGSAVDLSLVHLDTNMEIDMGSIFDYFDETSFTSATNISQQAKQSRMILAGLMKKHGFLNYKKEWWHFNFQDEKYGHFYFDFDIN